MKLPQFKCAVIMSKNTSCCCLRREADTVKGCVCACARVRMCVCMCVDEGVLGTFLYICVTVTVKLNYGDGA